MRLIVAEKPSVGRDIAGALGGGRKGKGSVAGEGWTVTWGLGHLAGVGPPGASGGGATARGGRDGGRGVGGGRRGKGSVAGEGWTVTWALGHLAELAPPDAYGEEYKRWRLESLPILPERFKVRVSNKTREQFAVVKGFMRDPSVTEVVNACDAGREGELIFAYLYGLSGCNKPVMRLWISSLTPEAIRAGFGALRDGSRMKPLEDAARSRGAAGWGVGLSATR